MSKLVKHEKELVVEEVVDIFGGKHKQAKVLAVYGRTASIECTASGQSRICRLEDLPKGLPKAASERKMVMLTSRERKGDTGKFDVKAVRRKFKGEHDVIQTYIDGGGTTKRHKKVGVTLADYRFTDNR